MRSHPRCSIMAILVTNRNEEKNEKKLKLLRSSTASNPDFRHLDPCLASGCIWEKTIGWGWRCAPLLSLKSNFIAHVILLRTHKYTRHINLILVQDMYKKTAFNIFVRQTGQSSEICKIPGRGRKQKKFSIFL